MPLNYILKRWFAGRSSVDDTGVSHKSGVYRIRNKVNGRVYIGATTRPFYVRWAQHWADLNVKRHKNQQLQADWNQFGADAFEFSVIEVVADRDRIFQRERYWQDKDFTSEQRYNAQNIPSTVVMQEKRRPITEDSSLVALTALLAIQRRGDAYRFSEKEIAKLVAGSFPPAQRAAVRDEVLELCANAEAAPVDDLLVALADFYGGTAILSTQEP